MSTLNTLHTMRLTKTVAVQSALQALTVALMAVTILGASFFMVEPQIGHGQENIDFRIRQTIIGATAFSVDPSNVNMVGSISGVTGGTATGTTQFVVLSNNASGYKVTIDFENNAGDHAMMGDIDGGDEIRNYAAGAGTPTPNLNASTAAQFAYSVHSSSSADTAPAFWFSAGACNAGTGSATGKCWKSPSDGTPVDVVDKGLASPTGATSTLFFKVRVPSGAVPVPTAQTYTATATLSVFVQ
jgi:hypothetical protein